MAYLECSLCQEIITAPQFYKGAPYGSSCIHKAIAMDVFNAGRSTPKKMPKLTGDIYMSFHVDKVEIISTEGKGRIYVWSSEFSNGYFDLKNWWGDGYCNLGQSVRYDEVKQCIIVNFGNSSYDKFNKKNRWKWNEKVLKKHGLIK